MAEILFLEDWDFYPEAIEDTKTNNKSFIRHASLLKHMGIKNHAWPLALLDKDLQGIDPFDPFLSKIEIMKIGVECKLNPWFFFREVARVPATSGTENPPLIANRGNMGLFWLFFNHITTILIQPRQTGKSLSSDINYRYHTNIACTNTDINIITKDDTLRSANLERLKDINDCLPFYFRIKHKNDIGNTIEFTYKTLGNHFRALLPSASTRTALKVGRGLTTTISGGDEFAFLENIEIILPAALSSGTAARNNARINNEPHGILLTTTAGKKDDRDGKFAYKIVSESATFTERFMDTKNLEELEQVIMKASKHGELRVNCTFSHRQLGYTDEWLRRAIKDSMSTGDDAERDYLNIWTSGTQSSPFSATIATSIRNGEKPPVDTIITDYGYTVRIWTTEEQFFKTLKTTPIIFSADPSDAGGGDDFALRWRHPETGAILAASDINETNLIKLSSWIFELFEKYHPMVGIIERRGSGSVVLDYLILRMLEKEINPFRRLFNNVVDDADSKPERFKEINKPYANLDRLTVDYKTTFGFATSGSGKTSREKLYSETLNLSIKLTKDNINDKVTIDQMLGLIIKNGRIDHGDGEHDDGVIAWLLSGWLLLKGKNLHYYGIDSTKILINRPRDKETNSIDDDYEELEQQLIRDKINNLIKQLWLETDNFVSDRLEDAIRFHSSKLKLKTDETFSVDSFLTKLKQSKDVRNIQNMYQNNRY